MAQGPAAGLDLLDECGRGPAAWPGGPQLHIARAELLCRLGPPR